MHERYVTVLAADLPNIRTAVCVIYNYKYVIFLLLDAYRLHSTTQTHPALPLLTLFRILTIYQYSRTPLFRIIGMANHPDKQKFRIIGFFF